METEQINNFKRDYKKILSLRADIKDSNTRLKKLHVWDKNGSHGKAILKEMNIGQGFKNNLSEILRGKPFEEWQKENNRLTKMLSKFKSVSSNRRILEEQLRTFKSFGESGEKGGDNGNN